MGSTRSNVLRRAVSEDHVPGDRSELVYLFDDGWSVRRLTCRGDQHREGCLMDHCWNHRHEIDSDWVRDYPTLDDYFAVPILEGDDEHVATRYHSLRDADNLPRVSFYFEVTNGIAGIHYALGRHNSTPKQVYLERLYQWLRSLDSPAFHQDPYIDGVVRLLST